MYDEERFTKLVKRYKAEFSKTMMYGVPICDLNPNELRACICVLGANGERARKNRMVSDKISSHSKQRVRDLEHKADPQKEIHPWSVPRWRGETS